MTHQGAAEGGVARGRYGPADCCLYAAALILAFTVVVAGLVIWGLHRALQPAAPDLAAVADSPSVRAADGAAARAMAQQLAQLRTATPWAVPLGTSVVDVCHAEGRSAFTFSLQRSGSVGCTRATALYLAFDGDLPVRLRQLDAAVAALPWRPSTRPDGRTGGLAALLADRREESGGTPDPPAPASSAPAGPPPSTAAPAAPIALDLDCYPVRPAVTAPAPGASPTASAAGTTPPALRTGTLHVSVASRPLVPQGGPWDRAPWTVRDGAQHRPFGNDGSERAHYYAWQPLSARSLAATGYRTRPYLVAFVLSEGYAPGH
ncbi:hypothetical protein [Streptomyces sp. NPDC020917]|uniref:hypothetical protein n=1 Tax=Streptomyces sp. NPDC020917 TaxID=3365102 RepID=UPI00379D819A